MNISNSFPDCIAPTSLTTEQKFTLAELVIGHTGTQVDFAEFCDRLLSLLEDVPGFENSVPSESLLREILDLCHAKSVKASLGDVIDRSMT